MENGIVEKNVKWSIRKSGFPKKIVRLPFKPVCESCRNHGISLKKVLENLYKENVFGKINGDYIIFWPPGKSAPERKVKPIKPFDFYGIEPEESN